MFKSHAHFLQFSKNLLQAIKNPEINTSPIKSFNTLASAMAQAIPDADFSIHQMKLYLDNQGDSIESNMINEFKQISRTIILGFVSSLSQEESNLLIKSFWEVHQGNSTDISCYISDQNEDFFKVNLEGRAKVNSKKLMSLAIYGLPEKYLEYSHTIANHEFRSDEAYNLAYFHYIKDSFCEVLDKVYEDFLEIVDYHRFEKISSQIVNEIMKAIDIHQFKVSK
jgi:hypothetical protein